MKVTVETAVGLVELELPPLHIGIMGEPSSGKSHFVASMEKPLLVLATDPFDKLAPYLDRGIPDNESTRGQFGQPVRLVRSEKSGSPIIQIEGFYDIGSEPAAMTAFAARCEQLAAEANRPWRSFAIDSWTQLEFIARERRARGSMAVKSAMKGATVYGAAKDDLQQLLNLRFMHLPCNVAVVLHTLVKTDFETGVVTYRGMKAIGELKTEIPGALGERYLARNIDGTRRQLDTKNALYNCCTLIDAPNPCANEFTALFSNWIAKQVNRINDRAASAAQPAPDAPQKG